MSGSDIFGALAGHGLELLCARCGTSLSGECAEVSVEHFATALVSEDWLLCVRCAGELRDWLRARVG